jgi:glyoxylase-like metal-dependent hydrolase (beta-lactamase superfamily II)
MVDIFPRQIADNIWILGNDYFHIYLIKGGSFTALMEIGISATADILLEQLSFIDAKPDFLIVSHPHSDHITGLDYLRHSFPLAMVIAGKGAESFISHSKSAQFMITEDRHMTDSMNVSGLLSKKTAIKYVPSLSGCKIINDGEELDLGGLSISFLDAKGHSPGNLLMHIPNIKASLVSDSLGNHYQGRGFFPTFFTGFTDYMETIDRLEKLDPMILGLAHNGLISKKEEIRDIFQEARKAAINVENYIISSKGDDEEIAKYLFQFYYTAELKIYSPQNILNCCRLLVRRVRELCASKINISVK